MGLENSTSTPDLSRRRFLILSAQALGLGAAVAASVKPAISHASSSEEGIQSRLICGATVKKTSKAEVEAILGMPMSTLHDYYEEYPIDPSCTGVVINIRHKDGAPSVPAILYPGILKNFPREWSEESLEILYELGRKMPGYYTPDHLINPALLVLSTGDSVSLPKAPHDQGIVTFRPATMSYRDLKNAGRIFVHEGAHLRDPMTEVTAVGSEHACVTCAVGDIEGPVNEDCVDKEKNPVPVKNELIISPLHDSIFNIFPGSSFKNPPPVMKEWADQEFEKLRAAGRIGSGEGPYDPIERWVYGIRQKFPVELVGVAAEFIMQNGPDHDFLMEAARPLVEIGVFQEAQIRSLRNLIVNEGPLKRVDITALRCIFI